METKNLVWIIGIILFLSSIIGGTMYAMDYTDDKITYVSSTEYISGDEGQVIVRLTDFKGNPLTATCYDTIQYPDKTIFLSNQLMTTANYGNYYHNFTLPTTKGVYTSNVNCTYGSKSISHSKTFHVSLLNSVIQARFDSLGYNITQNQVEIIQQINDTRENLTGEIRENRNKILESQNNLSNQIINFRSEVQSNFTTVIDLINSLNQSENQDHNELLSLLQFINQTTYSTQNTINDFRTETTNNFQSINNTLIGVKSDTEEILTQIENMTLEFNITIGNLSNEINYLINITETNQETNQQNFSTIINLINELNQTTIDEFDNIENIFLDFNMTLNEKLDWIMNITNDSHYEIHLLMLYHNISFTSLNIYPESNNCWVGGQWSMRAEVKNNFGLIQTDSDVYCNITTTKWGTDIMNYDSSIQKFRYNHLCDTPSGIEVIQWSITCDYI